MMSTNKLYEKINKDYFVIFGLSYCNYCKNAKKYLKDNNLKYKYYQIDDQYTTILKLLEKTNQEHKDIKFDITHKTFPVIFYKGKFVGGYSDLIKMEFVIVN